MDRMQAIAVPSRRKGEECAWSVGPFGQLMPRKEEKKREERAEGELNPRHGSTHQHSSIIDFRHTTRTLLQVSLSLSPSRSRVFWNLPEEQFWGERKNGKGTLAFGQTILKKHTEPFIKPDCLSSSLPLSLYLSLVARQPTKH